MWLLVTFVGLLALLALLLAIPFRLHVHLRQENTFSWQISASWFFGIIRTRFKRKSHAKPAQDKETESKDDRTPQDKPARRKRIRSIRALAGSKGFPSALIRFLRQTWSCLRWREWSLTVDFGLGDPADTGIAWGLLSATLPWTGPFHPGYRMHPDFSEEKFQFDLQGTVEITPLRFGAALLAFLVRPVTLRAFVAFIRARR